MTTDPTVDDATVEPTTVEGDGIYRVQQLNGHWMEVATSGEAQFYRAQKDKYLAENTFTAISDLTDLDRMLMLELQMFRTTKFLSSMRDYEGSDLTQASLIDLRRQTKVIADLIRDVKTDLGLTRTARQQAEAESVGAYLVELRTRAKEQGIKRERELMTALTLMHELISLVETYDRADTLERRKLGLEGPDDFLDWVRMKLIPQFRQIDEYFRANSQKYWVGRL
jgi:hypothetical protein